MNDELLKTAVKCFEEKDYKNALILFLEIANEDMLAKYYLGAIYRLGLGVQDDQKEAFKWFLMAAEQGHVESQYLVGCAYTCNRFFMFGKTDVFLHDYTTIQERADKDLSIWQDSLPYFKLNGIGTEPNDREAFKWISKAANQGYVIAQLKLGDMYDWGIGINEDEEEAVKWYKIAASQKNTLALRRLASYYNQLDDDISRKIEMLQKAVELGDYHAAYVIGNTYESDSQIEGHFEKAFQWYMLSAEQYNYYESQIELGDIYAEGKGKKRDINLAIKWYKKAIESYKKIDQLEYFDRAYRRLYNLYIQGYTEVISEKELIEYLKDSANHNNDSSRIRLRDFYRKGYDVGEKLKNLFELLEKAELGNKAAQIEYGYLCIVNSIIEDSTRSKAVNWYLDDAVKGSPDAQFLLSEIYRDEIYKTERRFWLKKAGDQGHSRAQYHLALAYKEDNPSESVKYMKLASSSYVYAKIDLGYDYAHGNLVNKNYSEAYGLYQKAALNMKEIKDIYELRTINYVKFKYNAANDEAEELALLGNLNAQLYMGCLYQYGFEIKRNKDKAIYWYEMAKRQGSDEAQIQLNLLQMDLE
ncbi:MAG: tetratricopeptide repeat protein [Candidatus Izemoplasmatales bacterium]|jgi:hypothetical protein